MPVTRIGSIAIEEVQNTYRVRIPIGDGKYKYINIKVKPNSNAYTDALLLAGNIDKDMRDGNFNSNNLEKYKYIAKDKSLPKQVIESEYKNNFIELWEYYKENRKDEVAETTKNSIWKMFDNALTKIPKSCFILPECKDLMKELLKHYARATVRNFSCCCLKPSIMFALKNKLIIEQPNIDYITYNVKKLDTGIFTVEEVREIINDFNIYAPQYADFIKVLAYTGRRPQDILALTKNDINFLNNTIVFSKAYTKGIVKSTKNNKTTVYPIASLPELIDILKKCIEKSNSKTGLLFYNTSNLSYIELSTFGKTYWKPILNRLVENKKISQYRPLYNLRHFKATQMLQQGIDLKTIAYLLETSIEMLTEHYLSYDRNVKLPTLEL